MRLATCLAILVAVALGGCGGSSDETTSPPAEAKTSTAEIRSAWEREPGCKRPRSASRWGCSVGAYRCQAVVTGRGWSVSCAKPGESLGFTVRRG